MDRKGLKNYKINKRELTLIDKALGKLYEQLSEVPVISGKVTKSSDDFPFIEEHMTVQMLEPKAATELKDKIRQKEARVSVLQEEIKAVEDFIKGLPEGIDKQIFELTYLEGKRQYEVADAVGYSRGRIPQIISCYLKD